MTTVMGEESRQRILIVEDELLVAMELETYLQSVGFEVLGPFASLDKAMESLASEQPDAAILDLNLNGTPSTPIAQALAERSIPFLVISGYSGVDADDPVRKDAPRLEKPIDGRAVVGLLKTMLGD